VPALNAWRLNLIFVARYKNGSCGLAEAPNEERARQVLESEEADFDPEKDEIVNLRPLSGGFVSRWYFDHKDSDDLEIDRLSGILGAEVTDEILEHEYPAILTAHATCAQEEPLFDEDADQATPLIYNRPQVQQMAKWSKNLRNRVRQAIDFELQRFR